MNPAVDQLHYSVDLHIIEKRTTVQSWQNTVNAPQSSELRLHAAHCIHIKAIHCNAGFNSYAEALIATLSDEELLQMQVKWVPMLHIHNPPSITLNQHTAARNIMHKISWGGTRCIQVWTILLSPNI